MNLFDWSSLNLNLNLRDWDRDRDRVFPNVSSDVHCLLLLLLLIVILWPWQNFTTSQSSPSHCVLKKERKVYSKSEFENWVLKMGSWTLVRAYIHYIDHGWLEFPPPPNLDSPSQWWTWLLLLFLSVWKRTQSRLGVVGSSQLNLTP